MDTDNKLLALSRVLFDFPAFIGEADCFRQTIQRDHDKQAYYMNQELLFCATADMIDECMTPCTLLKYKLYLYSYASKTERHAMKTTVNLFPPLVIVKGAWMVPSYLPLYVISLTEGW